MRKLIITFMRKRQIFIIFVLLLITVSICLVGCEEISVPPFQGSHVDRLDEYEEIDDKQVFTFDTYSQFKKSEFAEQSFSIWGNPNKNTWYSKEFFKTRNLILVKFNAFDCDKFFINKISETDDGYKVELTNIKASNVQTNPATFMCRLEIETKKRVKDAKITFETTEKPIVRAFGQFILDVGQPRIRFEKFNDFETFESYRKNLSEPYKTLYSKYDEVFFAENDVMFSIFAAFSYSSFSVSVTEQTLEIFAYSTEHYRAKNDRDITFHLPVVAPKGQLPVNYRYYTYWEAELGDSGEPTVLEGEIGADA